MIQPERILNLNGHAVQKGDYVLYWMQQAQRTRCNHALAFAIDTANDLSLPVIVFFCLVPSYPGANVRHYDFMLRGLQDVSDSLEKKGIPFVIRIGEPASLVSGLAENAALVITDRGYTRIQRAWRADVAKKISCPLVQIETDVIIPVETASPKEEFSAATLRRKIQRIRDRFLIPLGNRDVNISLTAGPASLDISDRQNILRLLGLDTSVPPVSWITGGERAAEKMLGVFIEDKLKFYDTLRNDPSRDYLSHLSPFLHFGQISPLHIALQAMTSDYSALPAFLEELIVRRELAMNYVHYNPDYDTYNAIPSWCKKTLDDHAADGRSYVYSRKQLERANTHDPYWNAAQKELVVRGKMHGYMRMYWGKKIIEWSKTPAEAFDTAVYLNDRFSLDGRDPNGYAGISWCFGKHDRPWREREIFGKIRYMNDRGLERKFDIKAYQRAIEVECGANFLSLFNGTEDSDLHGAVSDLPAGK